MSVVLPSLKILPLLVPWRTAPVETSYWEVTLGLMMLEPVVSPHVVLGG
jgi:hypothetical protein